MQPDQIRGASGGGWDIFRAGVKVSNVRTFSKKVLVVSSHLFNRAAKACKFDGTCC